MANIDKARATSLTTTGFFTRKVRSLLESRLELTAFRGPVGKPCQHGLTGINVCRSAAADPADTTSAQLRRPGLTFGRVVLAQPAYLCLQAQHSSAVYGHFAAGLDFQAVPTLMFWLWLGLKAMALARLEVALASSDVRPGQSLWLWLGLAWLWPRPWLYRAF
ncbi:hypothetical protein C8R44DRAFT_748717 [Mycena epipterygia]|nr:hypothetical protein C8R44DRAFT_748717 [Mycena epipterygia]